MPLNRQKERWGDVGLSPEFGPEQCKLNVVDGEQILSTQQQIERDKMT